MANECENIIKIKGKPENIKKFIDKLIAKENYPAQENHLYVNDYQKIFEKIESEDFEWGSKWQIFEPLDYTDGDESLNLFVTSAWAPAFAFWEKVSTEYDLNVQLQYSEPGNDFGGIVEWESGEEVENDEFSYLNYLYLYEEETFWERVQDIFEENGGDETKEILEEVYDYLEDEDIEKFESICN